MIFAIGCVFGLICALLASGKQRNPIGWFVIGFLLPLIGLILVIVLPSNSIEVPPEAMAVTDSFLPPCSQHLEAQNARLASLQRLADLRARGALTDAEFEQQKSELLGGDANEFVR